MKTDPQTAINDLLRIAEQKRALGFTCMVMHDHGRMDEYVELFSVHDNGQGALFLGEDLEYDYRNNCTNEQFDAIYAAREGWRRTALCFAVELILEGQL